MRPFHAEMANACEDLLKSITGRISLHQSTPVTDIHVDSIIKCGYWSLLPQLQSEVLCSLVCVLSSVPALYCQAVQQLISTVVECAKMLSRSTQGLYYINSYIERSKCEVLSSYTTNQFPIYRCELVGCRQC